MHADSIFVVVIGLARPTIEGQTWSSSNTLS